MYASVGKLCINNYPVTTSQALYAMKFKEDANIDFVYSALERVNVEQLNRVITQGTQKNINAKTLKNFDIPLPALPEQEKIGAFFSTLDEEIECQSELVDLLALEYKGYSQRIFSQERRFKDDDGNAYPDWEQKKLGEVLSLPIKERVVGNDIDINKLITVRLHMKGVQLNDRTATLKVGATNYFIRQAGQFIYGKQNLFNGALGIVPESLDGHLSSQDIPTLNIDYSITTSDYLLGYMGRASFYKNLAKLSTGTGSKRISEKTLLDIEIPFPSLPEQEKIGGFLSSLSERIESEEELLVQLKERKRAYLQKLFP